MNKELFALLKSRGYVYQCTNLEKVTEMLDSDDKITFYLGIDPTADSLHIGHFVALMLFRHLQDAGHRGILVIGGATALIGDPSGKNDIRKTLTKEQVEYNFKEVKTLAKRFIKVDGDNPAIILDNTDWINTYSYIDFMRIVGVHFNISTMLSADAYANRLEQGGLTFLEMSYMLMQAFDFVHLNKEYGCVLQIGGSDQWGNIVAGTSLNKKMRFSKDESSSKSEKNDIYGLTCPLLLTKEGKKMGKTESGILWIAHDKTTSYDFYQYFYNIDDTDVEMLLKLFTCVSLKEIQSLCSNDIIEAKRVMAYEITRLVHGEKEAKKVLHVIRSLFNGEASGENAPESEYVVNYNKINVVDLFYNAGLVSSKGEARRLIKQNGVAVDEQRCCSPDDVIAKPIDRDFVLLKKGKKKYMKVWFQ
ncbi:MAG: tyrosine--tRNA ligase [Oscillospiraceae bacterium]|nr:tyrosine--tRNA ligase [Oscillospiraceae bacterium]